MENVFAWIEHTAFSIWIRESLSVFAFPGILTLHTLGLAVLAGINAALNLRILGVAPGLPLAPLQRFFPLLWTSFWISTATGIALVISYPAKALTNPLFFAKLAMIVLALFILRLLKREVFSESALLAPTTTRRAKKLASVSLLLWASTIVSGRLLAYTYTQLLTQL